MADKALVTQSTLDAIGHAIISKGGASAPMTPAQMAESIAKIPSGWQPPSEWPDLRSIFRHSKGPFAYGAAFLFDSRGFDTISLSGAEKYITSDGATYTTGTATHSWDHSKDIDGKLVWVLFLFSSDTVKLSSTMVHYLNTLWVYAPGVTIKSSASSSNGIYKNASRLVSFEAKKCLNTGNNSYGDFGNTYALENFDVDEVQLCSGNCYSCFINTGISVIRSKVYSLNGNGKVSMIFGGYNTLIKVSYVDFGSVETLDIWYGAAVKFFPETMIIMKLLNGGKVDARLSAFAVPRCLNINKSFSFENTTYLEEYKDRFACFDIAGNLVGGMAYNMNEVDSSLGLTATISATIKGFFTAPNDPADGNSEQEKIEAAFNAKGWTLAW